MRFGGKLKGVLRTIAALLLVTSTARAQVGEVTPERAAPDVLLDAGEVAPEPSEAEERVTPEQVAEVAAEAARPLEWQPWLASAALIATTLTLELLLEPDSANWTSSGPVEGAFKSWQRDDPHRADLASDVFLYTMIAAPALDVALWQADDDEEGRDAYRLITGDVLAFSIQSLAVVTTKNLVRRARPYHDDCADEPEGRCTSSSRYRSFISGHTSAAFTGASLVCAHQRLRDSGAAGRLECVAALALASLTGALRIAAEEHHFGDVAAGAVVGFLSGYVVPLLVYPRAF